MSSVEALASDTACRDAIAPIPYSTLQIINDEDTEEIIVEKAAKVLPRPNQTAWMRIERTFFIHFGPNTFRHVEWGNGQEDPSVFNPTAFDAEQWISAIKDTGGKMVVLVCKHHDGLCLWPTRYTNHSVVSSPWLGGKGDVVKDVANACHKYGIKLGVYLSPADLYQLRTNPKNPAGYYGNESEILESVIPTDPANFKTDPTKTRPLPAGGKTYSYKVNDYNRYFLNQLYELLTEFGRVDEVWFDGANPDPSVPETYDYAAWYDLIRQLTPHATIAVKGPDVRWVGNEGGQGRDMEWSVIPLSSSPDTFHWPDMYDYDLGSRAKLKPGSYLWWYPAETNVPLLHGWFWAPGKPARTAAELIDIYYKSIGSNGNWLLNLSPDDRGLIPDDQLAPLYLMAQVINETFAKDFAAGGKFTADNSNQEHPPTMAMDNNLDTWWEAASGHDAAELILRLPSSVTFDVVSLQEAVDYRSQRIESFSVDIWENSKWFQIIEGTTVGHKRQIRLNAPVSTDQVRIRIHQSRLEPTLSQIGLYKQAELVMPPVISERDAAGWVTIGDPKGYKVVYTTDGSVPAMNSEVYNSPIALPNGGTVNAACIDQHRRIGMIASKVFSGFAPTGWKVIEANGQDNAINAIDSNPSTLWLTNSPASPHSIVIDMGQEHLIAGLSYLPRQDKDLTGVVEEYSFETSLDGKSWITNIDHDHFGNIKNNPVLQEVPFAPVSARYFRFTAFKDVNATGSTSAAEITVLPAEQGK